MWGGRSGDLGPCICLAWACVGGGGRRGDLGPCICLACTCVWGGGGGRGFRPLHLPGLCGGGGGGGRRGDLGPCICLACRHGAN